MKNLKILFTSAGRRVELISSFMKLKENQSYNLEVSCGDLQKTAPAFYIGDFFVKLPPITSDEYMPFILKYCIDNHIDIVIPLLDTELIKFSKWKNKFKKQNIHLLISSLEIISFGMDKKKTELFFKNAGLLTPQILSPLNRSSFPMILKPISGSASKGIYKIENETDLEYYTNKEKDFLIQHFVDGIEFTIDAWFGLNGNLMTVIPRKRLEVRSGEVSKGMTVNNKNIINDIKKIDRTYKGFEGCITFQCIQDSQSNNYFIEMNPRFGGGVPLSIAAGANLPLALVNEYLNVRIPKDTFAWKENIVMLRYDQGIYFSSEEVGL